jgi:hypothetical protein
MAKRSPGRPVSPHPKDWQIGVRLPEEIIDKIYRVKRSSETLAEWVRKAINAQLALYVPQLGGLFEVAGPHLPGKNERDTTLASIKRHQRAASRATRKTKHDATGAALEGLVAQTLDASGETMAG